MIKAACHVHSDWSYDGKWPLDKLASAFQQRGYRVVMMTEHDLGFTEARRLEHQEACARASSDEILVIPGIEYSDAKNIVHVLVWGPVPFLGEGVPTGEMLRKVTAANGVAVLAHPSRKNAWQSFDPEWSRHLAGIEVWNRKTDGWSPSRHAAPLLKGTSLIEFVGLDFHAQNQFFPLAMGIDIASPPSENTVLDSFRARKCVPLAFGAHLSQSQRPWKAAILRVAEASRRSFASSYRKARGRRGRAPAGVKQTAETDKPFSIN